jgi:hypothetical protein
LQHEAAVGRRTSRLEDINLAAGGVSETVSRLDGNRRHGVAIFNNQTEALDALCREKVVWQNLLREQERVKERLNNW